MFEDVQNIEQKIENLEKKKKKIKLRQKGKN
jgi:hypothetical protein